MMGNLPDIERAMHRRFAASTMRGEWINEAVLTIERELAV
jgi:hypothetical protein